MTPPSIGGSLDLASLIALYGDDTGARRHAPRTREEIRAAVHEMRSRGLGDHEIAQATGLAVEQIRRVLGEQVSP